MNHIESLEGRQQFAATFGTDGVAVLTFRRASTKEVVRVEQVLTDSAGTGAYVVASTKTTLQVQRVTAAGTVDKTWGKRGTLVFERAGKNGGGAKALASTGDRLYVLIDGQLIRYTSAGQLDATYGDRGFVKLAGFDSVNDFTLDAGNHIHVAGGASVAAKNVGSQLRVERFTSRGRLDKAFDGDGVYDLPFAKTPKGTRTASSSAAFIRALADGTTVVAGQEFLGATDQPASYTIQSTRAVKFAADGATVKSYGTNGVATNYLSRGSDSLQYLRSLQGIRVTGQPVYYELIKDLIVGSSGDDRTNNQFSVDGKGVSVISGSDGRPEADFEGAYYPPSADPQDLAVFNNAVARLAPDGNIADAFNGGQVVRVGPSTGGTDAVHVAVSGFRTAAGDRLLTAANTRGNDRVTLTLLTINGQRATS